MELAQLTGNYLNEEEADKTLIEVLLDGKSMYAAVCLPFGYFFVPSPEWLAKWAKETLAWISYEHGNPAHPVVVGFRPLANKLPGDDYPRLMVWKSEFFTWQANDQQEVMRWGHGEGLQVEVRQDKLTLAPAGAASQPAVLGEENAARLTELYTQLDKVAEQLGQAALALTALGRPQGATITAALQPLRATLAQGKQAVGQTKSDKVFLT